MPIFPDECEEIQGMEELKERLRNTARSTVLDKLRVRFGTKVKLSNFIDIMHDEIW